MDSICGHISGVSSGWMNSNTERPTSPPGRWPSIWVSVRLASRIRPSVSATLMPITELSNTTP